MKNQLFLLLFPLLFCSCFGGSSSSSSSKALSDSTAIDSTSLVNLDEEVFYEAEKIKAPKRKKTRKSSKRRGENKAAMNRYKNYERKDNSANEFAKAFLFQAVRMVYSDNFQNPALRILKEEKDEDILILEVEYSWSDRWVSNYSFKGILEVQENGQGASFSIIEQNLEVESLEVTEDRFETTLDLEAL
jgi:hypothetical protein